LGGQGIFIALRQFPFGFCLWVSDPPKLKMKVKHDIIS